MAFPVATPQAAIISSSRNVTRHLPTRTEDIAAPFELCRPLSQRGSFCHLLQYLQDLCKVSLQHIHNSEYAADVIGAMMIVWRVRGKIIRSLLCSIVCNNCAQCTAHTYEQT